ncbi:MAG: N-acetyltransferase [Candidatus Omnitrophota bacterium]
MIYRIEQATMKDAQEIHRLVRNSARRQEMLPRPLQSVYENLRNFFICRNRTGRVIGCCAMQIVWEDLAEIRSLAVEPRYHRKGIGRMLVGAALSEAARMEIKEVFLLTYVPEFFQKFGFRRVSKKRLPHKIWTDCLNCPQFPDCDEVAMLRVGKKA